MPLRWTDVGHRLGRLIFRRQRACELLGQIAHQLVGVHNRSAAHSSKPHAKAPASCSTWLTRAVMPVFPRRAELSVDDESIDHWPERADADLVVKSRTQSRSWPIVAENETSHPGLDGRSIFDRERDHFFGLPLAHGLHHPSARMHVAAAAGPQAPTHVRDALGCVDAWVPLAHALEVSERFPHRVARRSDQHVAANRFHRPLPTERPTYGSAPGLGQSLGLLLRNLTRLGIDPQVFDDYVDRGAELASHQRLDDGGPESRRCPR